MAVHRWLVCFLMLVAAYPALAGPRLPKVLYIHSDTLLPLNVSDVTSKLMSSGRFAAVDEFNAALATPTLAQLADYDAALVAANLPWLDRAALGNVLADFVDTGHGVVLAPFTNTGTTATSLGGRWTNAYNSILPSPNIVGPATLGTLSLPYYLPSTGVQTFSGGTFSYRPSSTALQAGAALAVSWSDDKPLSVIGPLQNRADIGFYPPSSDANPGYWNKATDGIKLMVNALLYTIRPKVLICAAASLMNSITDPRFTEPKANLVGTGYFGAIDLFDANLATPTLAQLKNYDIVFTWSNVPYFDPVAMGNVLADYTDWGGGVVVAMFASAGSGSAPLAGRFVSGGYQLINPAGLTSNSPATLGAVSYPSHPTMNLVASFNGGSSSFRPTTTSLPSNAIQIAQWSDGKPLIVASATMHNRADLGMYPPSSNVVPTFWSISTDGTRIMANTLLYTARPYIGILHSETNILTYVTQNRLLLQKRFSAVDLFTALQTATPTAAQLRPYSALLLWGDNNFLDAAALGNTLADYIDSGGGLVEGIYSNVSNPAASNSRPKGRWITQGYDITPESSLAPVLSGTNATLGTVLEPASPIATFVRKFDGGTGSIRQSTNPNLRGRRVMEWSDGKMLASIHNFRRRVDVGFFPPSSTEYTPGWVVRTDGTVLLANALDYVSAFKPCPGDFNGDRVIDDTDFVLFAGYYDNFNDPRGDLNGDGVTDDPDFVTFSIGYDRLNCP